MDTFSYDRAAVQREIDLMSDTYRYFGYGSADFRRWLDGGDKPGVLYVCHDVVRTVCGPQISLLSDISSVASFAHYLTESIDYYSIPVSDLQQFCAWCSDFGFLEYAAIALRVVSGLVPAAAPLRL